MDFKNSQAERSIITRDIVDFEKDTNNVYEAIAIMSKRSNQIATEMKEELTAKLQEFASSTDNLEEVFENREQIEISKFYERMPKPTALAINEFLEGETYVRRPEQED